MLGEGAKGGKPDRSKALLGLKLSLCCLGHPAFG